MMTMRQERLVSVIMPIYNGYRYLSEAIESVLSQTYRTIEVIVIDDGSTDRSADVVKRHAPLIRYSYQEHSGPSTALNHGIALAQGSFLSFIDADDLWTKDKLKRQMAVINGDPEVDAVFGHVEQFYSPDLEEDARRRISYHSRIMPGYSTGTMLIRREAFLRVGPFETKWQVGEFVEWYARAIKKGLKSTMLSRVLMKRRLHTSNMGIRERASQKDYLHILKANIDRQRENAEP